MTRPVALVAWLTILLCSRLCASSSSAQGVQTGTLRGTITDPQNQSIPGATITISSPALQGQRITTSDPEGIFVFRSLPPGEYIVNISMSGFSTVERPATVPLGSDTVVDARMNLAALNEQVRVTGELPPPIAAPAVGLNIRHEEVEALATSRTLQGIGTLSPGVNEHSPNTGQLVINGAFAFDNIFMLNGVDVNDNLFGSPQDLFIEDAIQETQVLTSGISAEYGRFSGGVVNAITKSGGNTFSGSYRLNLSNQAWVDETPFEVGNGVTHTSRTNPSHEATFGGPLVKDRFWFFAAGRLSSLTRDGALDQTGIAYARKDDNKRGEIKFTGTARSNHTFQGGYLNNSLKQTDRPTFGFSIDQFTLGNQSQPNWYAFGNYRGVLQSNLLAEAQYSERRFSFQGAGGTSTAIVDSPFITRTQDLAHYNAQYFDATDPEERNNRQLTGNLTYFVEGRGRHEVKGGFEWFRSQNTGGNSQSATSYVFDADYAVDIEGRPLFDATGHLLPVFVPGVTLLENWIAQRGAILNVDTSSFFAQDHWTVNRHLSADLGLRYERVRSTATGGIIGVDTDTLVPRLAASFDAAGDGRLVFHTTYGLYSGRYNEAQIGQNTNVGNPDETIGIYRGPRGQGRSFASGFDPANYDVVFGQFPTANVFLEKGLSSPVTKEFTASAGGSVGTRAYAETTYVWRSQSNFIEDFIDRTNGVTDVVKNGTDYGTLTNTVYRNSNVPERHYQGLILQGRYNLRNNWIVNGNWTVELKNDGNYEGESENRPGATGLIGDFPEAFTADRNFPMGRLQSFQRHRARVWSIYTASLGRLGDLSLSGLVRLESGEVYSLAATAVPLSQIQEDRLASYPDAPTDQTLYFGKRGSETYPGYGVLDVSLNYNIPVFRSVRPWLKLDLFNALNNQKLIGYNTEVLVDPTSPADALGRPLGYIKGDRFGQAQSDTNFPGYLGMTGSRAFRMAFGLRF